MSSTPIRRAREFVKGVALPDPPPATRKGAKNAVIAYDAIAYDAAREQAAVVGADVVAFVKGVTPEQRHDVVNALLLAQLVAKKTVPEPKTLAGVQRWYEEYF